MTDQSRIRSQERVYPELYALGYTAVPDFRDRTLWGDTSPRTAKSAGLPNITGSFARRDDAGIFGGIVELSGAFYGEGSRSWRTRCTGGSYGNTYLKLDASRSSSIYGASTTVQPPALTTRFLIRAKS